MRSIERIAMHNIPDAAGLRNALSGRRVIVVGGAGDGIGTGITRAVARAGAAGVAVVGRTRSRLDEAIEDARAGGARGVPIVADVAKPPDVRRAVAEAVEALGGVDVVITVVGGYAAYAPWRALDETPDDEWDRVFMLNLGYVFRIVRDVIPHFLAQGGGSIVSIGSLAATMGTPRGAAYGASKAGLVNLAQTVAAEYGRRRIRMNVINVGMVATPVLAGLAADGLSVEQLPAGTPATPDEAGHLAVFLASPLSHFINGQAVNFDGGATARCRFHLPGTDASMACHCS
jgi:3-oxoacyl-[acyl-carrier protein] reductase